MLSFTVLLALLLSVTAPPVQAKNHNPLIINVPLLGRIGIDIGTNGRGGSNVRGSRGASRDYTSESSRPRRPDRPSGSTYQRGALRKSDLEEFSTYTLEEIELVGHRFTQDFLRLALNPTQFDQNQVQYNLLDGLPVIQAVAQYPTRGWTLSREGEAMLRRAAPYACQSPLEASCDPRDDWIEIRHPHWPLSPDEGRDIIAFASITQRTIIVVMENIEYYTWYPYKVLPNSNGNEEKRHPAPGTMVWTAWQKLCDLRRVDMHSMEDLTIVLWSITNNVPAFQSHKIVDDASSRMRELYAHLGSPIPRGGERYEIWWDEYGSTGNENLRLPSGEYPIAHVWCLLLGMLPVKKVLAPFMVHQAELGGRMVSEIVFWRYSASSRISRQPVHSTVAVVLQKPEFTGKQKLKRQAIRSGTSASRPEVHVSR